jgi:N-acetylglucosamine kinase-like BadF-type ATPase
MQLVIGIDGGGTKTAAVILDNRGQVLGFGEGGPSTYGMVPVEMTRQSILSAVEAAARTSGTKAAGFQAAFLGLGSVVAELDRQVVRAMAASLGLAPREQIGVDHDCRVALAGGLSGRPGIVQIAGTGTSCYGRNAAGAGWRSGGWGPVIDDEGSSYWLGAQALRAAVLEYDGRGDATLLTQAVITTLHLEDMNDLMNRLYAAGMTRTEIAALAPLVFSAAARNDAVAQRVLRSGCAAIADCILAVARRLGFDQGICELAVTGGLTNAGEALFTPLTAAVTQRLPGCQVLQAELSPVIGAGILALQQSGVAITPAILENIKKTSQA